MKDEEVPLPPGLQELGARAHCFRSNEGAGKKDEPRGDRRDAGAEPRGKGGADFVRGDQGQILRGHPGNIAMAIKLLGVSLKQNEFSSLIEVGGLDGFGPNLDDAGAIRLRTLIHETFRFLPSKDLFEDMLVDEAHKLRFHPVREYLGSLKWDRIERLKTWLCYYLGADQTPYVEFVGRAFFIALVARVLRPGCKQDYVLILEGPQGAEKSRACEVISGEWFSDSLPDVRDNKDLSQHLQGKWLVEIAELSAMGRAETATLKAFITRTIERYRPSYGRREVIQPRQCVFIGTINDRCYLKDATGSRRFWPVRIGSIDLAALAADRDQLFAEAVQLFQGGAKWWPDKDFEAGQIRPEQEDRYAADAWHEPIAEALKGRTRVTVAQLARDALGFDVVGRIGTADNRRIIEVLTALGWTMKRSHGVRWYVPPGGPGDDGESELPL